MRRRSSSTGRSRRTRLAHRRSTPVDRGDVGVLARLRRSGPGAGHRGAGGERGAGQVTATPRRSRTTMSRERAVAGVGDPVGPRDRRADGDERSRRRVGVLAVGELLELDRALDAEVVRGVAVGDDPAPTGWCPGPCRCSCTGRASPARRPGRSTSRRDGSSRRRGHAGAPSEVVGHAPREVDVAGVGDLIRPADRGRRRPRAGRSARRRRRR